MADPPCFSQGSSRLATLGFGAESLWDSLIIPKGMGSIPSGIIRAESQRDSAPKPRVASRELPWEKRVVSANPNDCGAMAERGHNPTMRG